MSSLENTVRYESAGTGVAFREAIYEPGDEATMVVDCIALANADLGARRRYLFIGVDDTPGGKRRLQGVDRAALAAFRKQFTALIADAVDPMPAVAVRGMEIDGRLVGVVRIKDCTAAPYLTRRPVGGRLPAGVGFVRRGTRTMSLSRSDLQRMFAALPAATPKTVPLVVGFPGAPPTERARLPVLSLRKLPSELAAARLESMLAVRNKARKTFGQDETRIHRLVHAKFFGMETPFESHSDDSLLAALDNVGGENQAADEHYMYEVRSHRLGLVIANRAEIDFHDLAVRLTMPRTPGVGVADRIHAASRDGLPTDGYPSVETSSKAIVIDTTIDAIPADRQVNAFREPPRIWLRPEAASTTLTIDYELSADELDAPVTGSIYIDIEPESLRSV